MLTPITNITLEYTQSNSNSNLNIDNPLTEKVANAVVYWMEQIINRRQEALNNKMFDSHVWYPQDYRAACQKDNLMERIRSIIHDNKYLIFHLPTQYFTCTNKDEDEPKKWHFFAKDDVLPSDALKAALTGQSLINNEIAYQMAHYGALLTVLGEEKFNRLFDPKQNRMALNAELGINAERQPLLYFFKKVLYQHPEEESYWDDNLPQPQVARDRPKPNPYPLLERGQTNVFDKMRMICNNYKEQTYIGFHTPKEGVAIGYIKSEEQPEDHLLRIMKALNARTSMKELNPDIIKTLIELPADKVSMDVVKNPTPSIH